MFIRTPLVLGDSLACLVGLEFAHPYPARHLCTGSIAQCVAYLVSLRDILD